MCTNAISIATVGIDSDVLGEIESSEITTERCPNLEAALESIRDQHCELIVMAQPANWSLDRTGREVSAVIGNNGAIVLSPHGPAFAPGIFVVDEKIPSSRLISLIKRVARHPGAMQFAAAI